MKQPACAPTFQRTAKYLPDPTRQKAKHSPSAHNAGKTANKVRRPLAHRWTPHGQNHEHIDEPLKSRPMRPPRERKVEETIHPFSGGCDHRRLQPTNQPTMAHPGGHPSSHVTDHVCLDTRRSGIHQDSRRRSLQSSHSADHHVDLLSRLSTTFADGPALLWRATARAMRTDSRPCRMSGVGAPCDVGHSRRRHRRVRLRPTTKSLLSSTQQSTLRKTASNVMRACFCLLFCFSDATLPGPRDYVAKLPDSRVR